MIVACTSCKHRFEAAGYRDQHCPACGAFAGQPGARPCARCELPMTPREVGDVVIDECTGCGGLFLDREAVQRVLDDHGRATLLLDTLPRTEHHPLPKPGAKMYIKCPMCSVLMNRKLFASGAGVVIDVCKAHGTFFDAGELPAILEFVKNGGLEKAAKKAQLEPLPQAATRTIPAAERHDLAETALVDLLFALFR